jgi:hypothetical protein
MNTTIADSHHEEEREMARIQFSNLSVVIAMLASQWERLPGAQRFDFSKAEQMAARRHARFYGRTGKQMPRVMRAGSRPAERYRKRIEAGLIPESQILRSPIFAKAA